MRAKQAAEPHLSKVVPGTLLDRGCTCPAASFLPAGSPIGMEEEGCKESPGCGTSLSEEPGITGDTSCARAAFTSQESHRRSRQVHPPAPLPKCGGPALKLVSLTLPGTFHMSLPLLTPPTPMLLAASTPPLGDWGCLGRPKQRDEWNGEGPAGFPINHCLCSSKPALNRCKVSLVLLAKCMRYV